MEGRLIVAGAVHYVAKDEANGIKLKNGYLSRRKFFVILGVDAYGNAYGGVVFNSKVNPRASYERKLYHLPIRSVAYSFLTHDSFIDCSTLMRVQVSQLSAETLCGQLTSEHLNEVLGAVQECSTIRKSKLREYGIIP